MSKLASRIVQSISIFCVAAAAAAPFATMSARAETAPPTADISGRWQGDRHELARARACLDGDCRKLTLDVSRCGSGWCGVEVASNGSCGATALKIDAGEAEGTDGARYKGELTLAQGAEPYTVQASLWHADTNGNLFLDITGDTGGEFRLFRRTFPFHTSLVRTGAPLCLPEKAVSMLDEQRIRPEIM